MLLRTREPRQTVRPIDGPRTVAGKDGYRAENASMAHFKAKDSKVGPPMGSQPLRGTLRARGGKEWAH